ncbi:MAG: carbohydrate-binding family 6 protein, partial [Candidatus Neomarinimicrobiota bacterium]
MGVQDYALRITDNSGNLGYWAIGGDRVGAMYGGINIAEIVAAGSLADMKNEDQSPFIAKRGLKFNIPLDDRQPSFDDTGTAARENVKHMWDWAFWEEYLDQLARQRYNVLSLWNRHPFPTLVRLDDYPDVALDDVYDKSGNLIKEMDHSEKIDFWRKIMDYAYDRGIEIYWFVWNIELLPIVPRDLNDEGEFDIGAYGISRHPDNQITIDYIRQSTKALFRTYPRLAGLGITSGEKMHWAINGKEVRMEQAEKEDWLWDSYGKGVMDFKQEHPERKVHFIHRYWLTDYDAMESHFSRLPDGYDLSYKYVKARLYSTTKPPWLWDDFLENLPAVESKSTWWNLRNDDIYILRWGDPDYVRQFILNFPTGRLTAGYYMGSDRHCWGRESFSKNPQFPRQLENEKHWYKFLLWGRLGYDPDTPTDLLKGLIKNRFPNVDANALYNAWQSASRVIPLVNQFHWLSWDYMWWVEACISSGFGNTVDGFHTVNDFIDNKTMEGSGLTTIPDFVNGDNSGISPLQVADNLEQYAKTALATLTGMTDGGNQELRETLGDIRAQAHLGAYYAHKIRGAVELQRFREFNGRKHKAAAVKHLENALIEWRRYANVLDTQY